MKLSEGLIRCAALDYLGEKGFDCGGRLFSLVYFSGSIEELGLLGRWIFRYTR